MADEKALVPVEEQTVDFYGDEITTALVEVDGNTTMYVPIKAISDYLGLTWSGQFERIQRDPVLSEVATVVRLTRITATGGIPGSLCLPIEYLNGWLFGINASRVKAMCLPGHCTPLPNSLSPTHNAITQQPFVVHQKDDQDQSTNYDQTA